MSGYSRVERLTEPGAGLGEGPVWDPDRGQLLWVDIVGRQVNFTDPNSEVTTSIDTPAVVGAVALDGEGKLLVALPDGVHRRVDDGWQLFASVGDPKRTRANDSKCDPSGNLLVGTMDWEGKDPVGGLYRLTPNGEVEVLRTDLTIANGLAWDDQGTLWHIDTPTRRIVGFRYQPDRPLGEVVGVIEIDPPGYPDGMCIDAEGCLWVAVWGGQEVRRIDRDGRVIDRIAIPASHVTSCAFGSDDLSQLFITTATHELENPGFEPEAGAVFVAEPGVVGLPADRFGI
jgi:sugar lactone lactonase YvrE